MERLLCLHCKYARPYDLADTNFYCTFFKDCLEAKVVGRDYKAFKDIEINECK